ncbi:cyclase family protein [Amycolatopsis minnesotensis]|uniref:Cyclase family protein n=1 Tax=Amycolatopsis minnesotensis TaxID=337894 RepID=A0ABN2QKE2_9PSEU
MNGKRIVDLSHEVYEGMLTHPWMPKPTVTEYISREQSAGFLTGGVSFHQVQVTMAGSTGTVLQVPFQYYAEGPDLAGFPVEHLVDVPIVVVPAAGHPEIPVGVFADLGDLEGTAVLLHTGQDRLWGTSDYFEDTCFLAPETVDYLTEARPRVVGVDSKNTDSGADQGKPAQHRLLGAGIAVLTSLTGLGSLPRTGAALTVLPVPVAGAGSFPVRPVAVIEEADRKDA